MKSIGFPPGANNFRLLLIVILVAVLWVFFLDYTDGISVETEKASIQQTKNIINSSLTVVFATYAVRGELGRLNELDGGNPFVLLAEFNLVPANYHGVTEVGNLDDIDPGWYYDMRAGKVIYKTYYSDQIYNFSLEFEYRDIDGSGRFDFGVDEYQHLYFRQLPQQ